MEHQMRRTPPCRFAQRAVNVDGGIRDIGSSLHAHEVIVHDLQLPPVSIQLLQIETLLSRLHDLRQIDPLAELPRLHPMHPRRRIALRRIGLVRAAPALACNALPLPSDLDLPLPRSALRAFDIQQDTLGL